MKKNKFVALSAVAFALAAAGWIGWNARRQPTVPTSALQPVPGAPAPVEKPADSKPPGFDRREAGLGAGVKTVQAARQDRKEAARQLQVEMPMVRVDFDERLGLPKFISSTSRFLTDAGGQGGSVTPEQAAAFPKDDVHRATKAFMAAHPALFGRGPELLDEALVSRDYVTPHNGMRTTVWQQAVDGVRVFESTLQSNVTAKGELVNIGSRFVPDARAAAENGTPDSRKVLTQPAVDAPRAVSMAAASVGDTVTAESVVAEGQSAGISRKQAFSAPSLLDVSAEFIWLPLDESAMRLCWEVVFTSRSRGEMFRTLVDAVTGDAVLQQRLTEYITPASYRVFTGDSPTPMSPGHATPQTTQPAQAARQLVTLEALDPTASPAGWINDGITETRGNNVDAHLDLNADNVADTPRPQSSGAARVFDPPLDLTNAPSSYGDASVVNLFYWNNVIHDRYHALGFTEAAGNFQVNNFGRGGVGNDAVQADAQDGSGTNNANFSTPADGSPGRMQMYNFTGPNPDRDGDFDQEIIIHEYTHGLSNRLVGGGVGMSAPQSRGMGEGWSDFYSLCLLSEPGDDPTGTYASGAYASYQLSGLVQNYYFGIRRYPYCTTLTKNPLTFKDIDPAQADAHAGVSKSPLGGGTADEVHNQGEVWCVTLWDVRANLIAKHGAAAGNELVMRLVMDGMKLSPANPNFVQARDAILQADLVYSNGANRNELWAAFAKRGLGAGASSPGSDTTAGLVESFDLPDTLSITPGTSAVASGSLGGPFTPEVFPFSLYNAGTAVLPWTVTSNQSWLTFPQTGGTVVAGGQISLQATLNAAAATLQAGDHVATVTFTNHDTGISQIRSVTLKVEYVFVPVFFDDFESGTLDPAFWTISGTGPHRTQVTTANGPRNGSRHLTEDSSTDVTYARNEATISLDLTGQRNLVLRFWAKMFNDEPDAPPNNPFTDGADFDGVAISADGTDWYEVQALRSLTGEWQQISVDLDAAMDTYGLTYGPNFKIRFNHYDNYGISTDGFAFDDVMVANAINRRLQLNLAASANEGSAPVTGTVMVTPNADGPLHVDLISSDTSEATVTPSVVIPAGANSATFSISFPDDSELDGTQTATLTATAATFVPGTAKISVHDTETAVISLDVPAAASEDEGTLTGTVNLSAPPAKNVRVALASGERSQLLVPSGVEVPAGQTAAPFAITLVDDGRIDGTVNVAVTAHVQNWTDATASIAIGDNETSTLSIQASDDMREGNPAGTGTVRIPGTLLSDLVVSLASSDTTEAVVSPSVTIYAGQTSASFAIEVPDDGLLDGTQPVILTASAVDFPEAAISTTVADNDAASFSLSPIAPSQIRNAPIPFTLTACDIDGDAIPNYTGTASFSVANPSDPVASSPASGGGFVNGTWTGSITIGEFASDVRLTAEVGGIQATSTPFNVGRGPLNRLTWAQIASPKTIDNPFNVSLRAEDAGGNLVEDFAGAVSLGALALGPSTPTGTGTGTNSDLDTFYTQSRFQCIYSPAEVGGAGRLLGLDLNLSSLPGMPLENFTIRVKPSPSDNYNTSSTGWQTTGWTTVYRNTTSIGATGWFTFQFQAPFDYDGTSSLMVDFSYNSSGSPGSGVGTYQATSKSDYRRVYYHTIFDSDPLNWSDQDTPAFVSTQLPNLRFISYNVASPIRPAATGAFSGGLWSGSVSIPSTMASVKLLADDGAGHTGTSNDFAVQPAKSLVTPGTLTETFEKLPLENVWAFTGTSTFRTQVSTANQPHGGTRHLVMDSSSYSYSRNEATWTVNLSGLSGVVLKFWAKCGYSSPYPYAPTSPFTNGADFDGVAISANGTTWYEVQSLRTLSYNWTQFTVNLDSAASSLGLAYNSSFKIRFNHFGDDDLPYSGIAVDDIEISSTPSPYRLKVTGPAQIREGDGPASFAVTLPFAAATDTVITLNNPAPAKASVPAQVTVPAGRLSASFPIQAVDDPLVDGSKTVEIGATSAVFPTGSLSLTVLDNDLPSLTFNLPTTTAVEGSAAIQATVAIGTLPAAPVVLNVSSSTPTAISVPATITIPLGSTSAALPLTVVNDSKVDGTQWATITVTEPGSGLSKNVTIAVEDNETLDLQLVPTATPAPSTVSEGAGGVSFSAKLPGTVATATTLTFTSSSPAKITPPLPVSISSGSTTATVIFNIVDDPVSQPSEPITLTASAPGFNSATYLITFLDNDPHHFTFAPIASPQVRAAPFAVKVTACDAAGAALPGFTGQVTLAAGGNTIQPSLLAGFTAGVWNGKIRVNETGNNVVLTIASPLPGSGSSNPFDVGLGTFQQFIWEPISPAQTPATHIAVAVKAADVGGNTDPTVNEPVTVKALTPLPAFTVGDTSSYTSGSFLYTYYGRSRAEVIYLASELGGRRTLGGIALNVRSDAANQQLSNLTIRLKTTSRSSLTTAAGWDADGWTTVHQSNQTLSANGWMTLLFDAPFEYNGRDNLLVDYSYNSAANPGTAADWYSKYSYSSGGARTLYGYSSSATDPLTWSGTSNSPDTSYYLPHTRFLTLQPIQATIPAAPQISGGTWSGVVSFGGNAERVFLHAEDSSGRRGTSNGFRIGSPALPAATTLPFADGFETGPLGSQWISSSTSNGRVSVLSTNTPHTGTYHAILDSSSGTARTELTLPLDLAGYNGVTLGFWAKRFDSTEDGPPAAPFTNGADFDGVAMSADGISWYEIKPLRGMTTGTWTSFTVNLDAAAAARGLVYNSNFRIRFNQYGNDYVPYDGIAIDDVSVTGNPVNRLTVTLPAWIGENTPPAMGTVTIPSISGSSTTVALSSSSPLALSVPSSVVIPAGQSSTTFALTPTDNATISGAINVRVTGTADGLSPGYSSVEVRDDDAGTLTLSVPASISETSGSATATLTISPPAVGNLTVPLTSSLPAVVQVPATVEVPPGQTSATIPLTIVDDTKLTGPQNATISATPVGWAAATASTTVVDDEDGSLRWASTAAVNEGGTANVTLYVDGSRTSSLVVSLYSDSPSLSLPSSVTIPAGSTSVPVTLTGINNNAVEGVQSATIVASAPEAGTARRDVTVYDNDAHHFTFAPIASSKSAGVPFPVSVSAYDLDNRLIPNYAGTLTITAAGDTGTISRSPTSITFAAGSWNGNMTINSVSDNVRLTVSSSPGYTGTSDAFNVVRAGPAQYVWSAIGATQTAGQPFTATISARSVFNGPMSTYSGYVVLSSTGSERVIGSGTSTSSTFPLYSYYHDQRTQVIYPASEVGASGTLSSLSLYVIAVPGQPLNAWTIRMKQTSLASYSSASWESTGWTTVYSSNQTISQTGWVTFNFSTPFSYSSTSNLMVDFSFNNSSATFPGTVRTFAAGSTRTLYYPTNSGYGNPLTWSATSPYPSMTATVPQVKFNAGSTASSVHPSTVLLTNGTWTGYLRMGSATSGTSIAATDFTSATGNSGSFSVIAAPDSDGDGLPDAWETANSLATGSNSGDNGGRGDPDLDGIPNILEYAFNLNPRAAGTTGLPVSAKMINPVDGEDYLEFTYLRRIGAPGITYTVETSADCVTWSSSTAQYQAAAGPLPTGDGVTETVTVRILPKMNTPGTPMKYARLRVNAQ